MRPVDENVFCGVSSIFMHICFLCNIHSFHFCTFFVGTLFLINSCSALYSVPCLDIISSPAQHVEDFIYHPFSISLRLFSFGMIPVADVTKASLNGSHFEFQFPCCPSYPLFKLSIYLSFRMI